MVVSLTFSLHSANIKLQILSWFRYKPISLLVCSLVHKVYELDFVNHEKISDSLSETQKFLLLFFMNSCDI